MPKVTIYDPRGELVAEGEVPAGRSLLQASLNLGAKHGSACGGVCACSTCHVWVKKGAQSLSDMEDGEADQLDKAYDVKAYSRLGCQAELDGEDVVYQITEESERTWYDEHPKERHEAEAAGTWPPK
ncbi:MAG TPA: 2Fe-2S iron-sulfur cluster-binding protein [Myxococcales bacterium]|nr:2Fe-2S iron-sulfur cluster-binding protein [Myxococcales bacterium]